MGWLEWCCTTHPGLGTYTSWWAWTVNDYQSWGGGIFVVRKLAIRSSITCQIVDTVAQHCCFFYMQPASLETLLLWIIQPSIPSSSRSWLWTVVCTKQWSSTLFLHHARLHSNLQLQHWLHPSRSLPAYLPDSRDMDRKWTALPT